MKSFAIIGVIPCFNFVTAVNDAITVDCARTQQVSPVLAEKHLVVDQVPIPNRQPRANQREVETFFGAGHLAFRALLVSDIATDANAVALTVEIRSAAIK